MLLKIDHINLTVRNLEESAAWYAKLFGFEKVESGRTRLGQNYAILSRNDFSLCMTEHPELASGKGDVNNPYQKIWHFGLRISDREEWRAQVVNYNLKLNYGGEVDYPSSTSWYIEDPSGHEIEVNYAESGAIQFK